jgi:hypothetical protein
MLSKTTPYNKAILNDPRQKQSIASGEIGIHNKLPQKLYIGYVDKLSDVKPIQTGSQARPRIRSRKFANEKGSIQKQEKDAWFLKYVSLLEQLRKLPENWDSYGADPPNLTALYWSKTVLELLLEINFTPNKITASVENGVGISFIQGEKYADIECFNTGEILAVTSDKQGNPNVWQVDDNLDSIKSALEKIYVFIRN